MDDEQTPAQTPAQAPTPEPARRRFRDRVWDLRTVVVVAVVALLLGGGIGAALASIGGDHGKDHRPFGPGPMMGQYRPGGPMMHPGRGQIRKQQMKHLKQMKQMKQFRQFQRFRQWEKAHPTPSPSASAG